MAEYWIIAGTLVLSVFFSGIEIALLGINPYQSASGNGVSRIERLLHLRYELVSTMLIGNNIAIVGATLALDNLLLNIEGHGAKLLIFGGQTVVFFIIGEALPKSIFRRIHLEILNTLYPLIMTVYYLFRPASSLFIGMTRKLLSLFPQVGKDHHDDLVYFIGSHFLKESKPISRGLLSLKNTKAEEIMTPFPEIFSLNEAMNVGDSLEMIKSTKYTRYPVYRNRGDNIVGYINVFDILTAKDGDKIGSFLYEAVFIPDQLRADQLLFRMQRNQWPLVFLVNEYGTVAGIVSLENIAEEIVGDDIIAREQMMETPDIVEDDGGYFLLDGSLNIDDFNDRFQLHVEKKGFETIAGCILYRLGYFPQPGDSIEEPFGVLTIEKGDSKSIELIKFQPKTKKQVLEVDEVGESSGEGKGSDAKPE